MADEPIAHTSDTLKALSSPLRRSILRQLGTHGPATSTTIGQALGENTGTTSYHLRQLAAAGLIAEIPERAKGRERWWRTVPADRRTPPRASMSDEDKTVHDELERARIAEDYATISAALADRDALGEWLQGSRGRAFMTLDQLRSFHEDYLKLLRRYGKDADGAPEGARAVTVRWFAFVDES
ncbi:MAG TPA: helix-turn-helix domain-containing protein [Stackebrandtia sp.]|jgi:DNA-binding transcriptional ArsR family regulator|uniref:ArsR/SmtB family transcription factor n=1 Tax=Stackebrandtia sp. TaxID=2023065 RepID=UPI002D459638|nr:helix-turn-helix domain-containing protein [Stackebrandtia sp.]HZE39562.1 helix-turn-helix domain-containing protein [Stackebrandtia sp.]